MATAMTRLDGRMEAALGDDVAALYAAEARADTATARTLQAHRALAKAETQLRFQRVRLLLIADRQQRVDDALLDALDAQLELLENLADVRDERESELARKLHLHEIAAERADAQARTGLREAVARAALQAALQRRH